MSGRAIPDATVARLPVYHRVLVSLADSGSHTVSSEELATACGVTSAKLRKDLKAEAGSDAKTPTATRLKPRPTIDTSATPATLGGASAEDKGDSVYREAMGNNTLPGTPQNETSNCLVNFVFRFRFRNY